MNTTQIKTNTRIYYSGDMANVEDYGTVTLVTSNDYYGSTYHIALDDGRTMTAHPFSFTPGPGTRFHIAAERVAQRRSGYASMLDQLGHSDADKARSLAAFDANHANVLEAK